MRVYVRQNVLLMFLPNQSVPVHLNRWAPRFRRRSPTIPASGWIWALYATLAVERRCSRQATSMPSSIFDEFRQGYRSTRRSSPASAGTRRSARSALRLAGVQDRTNPMGACSTRSTSSLPRRSADGARREHRPPSGHPICRVRTLQRDHVVVTSPQPPFMVIRVQDRDHRLGMDRRDQLVRIADYHREPRALCSPLPEARDRKQRLILDLEPHFALHGLFAIAEVVRLRRPLAKLGQRDEAAGFPVPRPTVAIVAGQGCARSSSAKLRPRRERPTT